MPARNDIPAAQGAAPNGGTPRVPAVRNAIAVLRHLHATGNEPSTMTSIASAVGMNRSTCFSLLKVLAEERFLTYDESTKAYRLGPALIDLASVVDAHGDVRRIAMDHARRLARELRLTVAIVRLTAAEEFVVLDKEDSPEPFRVTMPLGERFPVNSPVLTRAYFAFLEDDSVDALIERMGLPRWTESTVTDPDEFRRELRRVRHRGYAASLGEYYPGKNTVASPVFDRYGQVTLLLLVVGLADDLPPDRIVPAGELLRDAAAAITAEIGGSPPPRATNTVTTGERGAGPA